ncbi:Metalloendopeptidase [Blumeria hordei DH14]|uniref:Metalloendopeptidase n=1 Tax=Blumeria graminis f. sp. hordei (strain DH14) TaxID=546991 RepID=N1JC22_BLUG1|nr:Metalloendopeptidase [Blumeria hordei DH14]
MVSTTVFIRSIRSAMILRLYYVKDVSLKTKILGASPNLYIRPLQSRFHAISNRHISSTRLYYSRQPWGRNIPYDPAEARNAKPLATWDQIYSILTRRTAKWFYSVATFGTVIFYVTHLETVPASGRTRFMFFTAKDAEEEGKRIYQTIMRESKNAILPPTDARTRQVNRVLRRLITANSLEHIDWEVNVIYSNEKNAFVIPGGKVFIMSGILPIAQTDAGLASVLSHEIAHGIANHQAERMSSSFLIIWPLRIALFFCFDIWTGGILGNLLLEYGVNRPASRTQEREADYIGLMMMAKACYDPGAAVVFWKRIEQLEKAHGKLDLTWLSTHPSTTSRAELIKKWLPRAEAVREKNNCATTNRYYEGFRPLFQPVTYYPI